MVLIGFFKSYLHLNLVYDLVKFPKKSAASIVIVMLVIDIRVVQYTTVCGGCLWKLTLKVKRIKAQLKVKTCGRLD